MPLIDFSRFPYFPSLCCSDGEQMGYRQLSDADKDALLPIFELGQRRPEDANLEASIHEIQTTIGARNFILDLNKDPAPPPYIPKDPAARLADADRIALQEKSSARYNAGLQALLNPSDGFSTWLKLVQRFPNAVPVIQYQDAKAEALHILRQGALLAAGNNSIAIRITPETDQAVYAVVAQLCSVLPQPDRLLVIIDCGYGRQRITSRQEFAANALSAVLQAVGPGQQHLVRAVCMSSSFPNSSADGLKSVPSYEWDIWRAAREIAPIMIGDRGAIHRLRKQNTFVPPEWRATVVYSLDDGWLIYRHPNANDSDGWCEGSRQVRDDSAYPPGAKTWGTELIGRAADDDITGINSARFWHAAKVNIHIHKQLKLAAERLASYERDDGEDDDDEEDI